METMQRTLCLYLTLFHQSHEKLHRAVQGFKADLFVVAVNGGALLAGHALFDGAMLGFPSLGQNFG